MWTAVPIRDESYVTKTSDIPKPLRTLIGELRFLKTTHPQGLLLLFLIVLILERTTDEVRNRYRYIGEGVGKIKKLVKTKRVRFFMSEVPKLVIAELIIFHDFYAVDKIFLVAILRPNWQWLELSKVLV